MKFKVGDVVEYCGTCRWMHGEMATVVDVEYQQFGIDAVTKEVTPKGYRFILSRDLLGDGIFRFRETSLRKHRPPEELGSWSEIEKLTRWNPTRVSA